MKSFQLSDQSRHLFLSRILDYSWLYLLCRLILDASPLFYSGMMVWLLLLSIPFLWIPIGAVFLKKFGRTPGLLFFGLTLKHMAKPLSWSRALWQSFLPYTLCGSHIHFISKAGFLRKVIALLLAVCSATIFFQQEEWSVLPNSFKQSLLSSEWVDYTHDEKGFRIQFPSDPSEKDYKLEAGDRTLNYTEVISEKRKKTYKLRYMKLPRKWGLAGDNTILKVSAEMMLKALTGSSLVSKQMITHQNFKAIDFIYQVGDEEVHARLVLANHILYQLAVHYPKGNNASELVDTFFNSFELTNS